MQTQTPPTTKKAPRYSVMKNDSLGFVKYGAQYKMWHGQNVGRST